MVKEFPVYYHDKMANLSCNSLSPPGRAHLIEQLVIESSHTPYARQQKKNFTRYRGFSLKSHAHMDIQIILSGKRMKSSTAIVKTT